jgi:cytosine/adenosine deaminase-related metal-dependent hydrolase
LNRQDAKDAQRDSTIVLRARYVAPLDRPVIANGFVSFAGDRIGMVGSYSKLRRSQLEPRNVASAWGEFVDLAKFYRATDLGDVILLPGFVNAHTHLELSHLAGRVAPSAPRETQDSGLRTQDSPYPLPDGRGSERFSHRPVSPLIDWLDRLMAERMRTGDDPGLIEAAVRLGLDASLAAGVVALGDITRVPHVTRPLLRDATMRVVSFGEVTAVGQRRQLLAERVQAAIDASYASRTLTIALSPHAPYSVEPEGLRACAEAARRLGLRVCVHVAESAEEELFTLRRAGPFCDALRRLGIWDDAIPCSGVRPVPLLDQAGLLGPTTVLAHANYVSDDDIQMIAARGAHVAYCPRTHAAFGHAPHRWRSMLAAGVNVCIGTDSLASNPSLSVLDELRFLHELEPEVAVMQLLQMGTIHGAQALGLDAIMGTLTPGKRADIVAIPIPARGRKGPLVKVLESAAQPTAVWIGAQRAR